MMSMTPKSTQIVTAQQAQGSAKWFYYGNILAGLLPVPFFILWFGGAIITYAMLRHHPNPRVGYYTQIGTYIYYGLAGSFVPILTFASFDFFVKYWWQVWVLCALVLVPSAIYQIIKINREKWYDVTVSH
jgi:hypothetical protein